MAHSTRGNRPHKPKKPRPDFPLFPHATGRWAKKVRGKLHYFGKVADDPRGEAALNKWLDEKDALLAGRTPRASKDTLTMGDAVSRFIEVKESQRDSGDIRQTTFDDYYAVGERLLLAFGKSRLVDDLASDDFEGLRKQLAKKLGPHALSREIQAVRTLFKYLYDAGVIDRPVRFGPAFKRPAKRIMRAHRQASGPKMLEAKEIRTLYYSAEQPLRAMILLAVNCGFGNHDCGTLQRSALDLQRGWVSHPRPKTAIERRCPLWADTVAAIEEAISSRPKPKDPADGKLVFLTKYGQPWAKDTTDNPVTKEFRKLLNSTGIYRRGIGFYALRHVFQTIADEARDPVATQYIMGHSDGSMSGVYRERISDERLIAVTNHVHSWLFPRPLVG